MFFFIRNKNEQKPYDILIVEASIFCLNKQIFGNVLFMGNIQN